MLWSLIAIAPYTSRHAAHDVGDNVGFSVVKGRYLDMLLLVSGLI